MKNSLWVIIIITVAILAFLIGYSLAPRTDLQAGPGGGEQAGGYGQASGGHESASGGYGAPAGGGYGGGSGGYGH